MSVAGRVNDFTQDGVGNGGRKVGQVVGVAGVGVVLLDKVGKCGRVRGLVGGLFHGGTSFHSDPVVGSCIW